MYKRQDTRWILEIGFSGAGTDPVRFNIGKYVAEAAGLEANAYGQMPQGKYDVVLDIEELIKAYDADNGKSNYDKIFGEGGNSILTTVNITYATNDPANNSDKDQAFILNEIAIGDANAFPEKEPEETTLYSAAVDTLDNWLTYDEAHTCLLYTSERG